MTTEAKFPDSVLGGRLTLAKKIHESITDDFTNISNDDIAALTIAVILVGLVLRDELRAARLGPPPA